MSSRGNVVGGDIVEYNPLRDVNGVTAMVAAKFYKEIAAHMLPDTDKHGFTRIGN